MEKKKFNLWNRIAAIAAFVISAFTYLSTIEPSASYWDCGEFIASSYKLEVGHPPGNPVFQLIARVFTLFGDNMHAAVLVNSMSAICSALTIFFLYLTIVFFAKRLMRSDEEGRYSTSSAITIIGCGLVGALAYCFSDTFWFSAVEGEVYAMSSLFTAMVFWAMTKWYEVADEPYANRWIVLISFMMGISIGIHLLNLLAIPALVFMYFYKKNEKEGCYKLLDLVKMLAISVVIIAVILFAVVPWLPKLAAYADLFFVNTLGLPFNSGAAFFMVAVLALCFWGLFYTLKKQKAFLNTVLLCLTTIIIGFSIFSIDIIRSCAKTPTNEYQPDNAFTLVRYLSREQYGSTPLIYGQYYGGTYDLYTPKFWTPLNGKYVHADGPVDVKYRSDSKMLFPRMWNSSPESIKFYESYTNGKGKKVSGSQYRKPTMGANLAYFFDYQMNWMYWRYFMWNFAGRQNEIHSPSPSELYYGNWESGIGFLDKMRLGDQSDAPAILSENKGKNHYFMLPLLLGLIGLFYQFGKDKRGCWLVFLMFFMTGIAIVLYLNQPPYQVRERDYAYAGSFYSFCIWIGFAVAAIVASFEEILKGKKSVAVAAATTVACLAVPALMAEENWDDHDRSNRKTAVEMAKNYLNSVGENGILITHGDNDTFPLWYAQEVEEVRTDVRIVNTSLLGTDWHIDQMKYAVNESAPLDLTVPLSQYLYGQNDWVPINDSRNQPTLLSDVMKVFKHPDAKLATASGMKLDYIMSRKLVIPVNKENCLKYGIVSPKFADAIPDSIMLEIPEDKDYVSKPELFMLDFLSNYNWDRPLHVLNMGGDLQLGISDYLMYEGYSSKFVPFKNKMSSTDPGIVDTDHLYELMTKKYTWDAIGRDDYFIDYQNCYTHLGVMSQRGLFVNAATAFYKAGENDRALKMLDKGVSVMSNYPIESIILGFTTNDYMVVEMVSLYYRMGQNQKAHNLAVQLFNGLLETARFYLEFYDYSKSDFELCSQYVYYLQDEVMKAGDKELGKQILESYNALLDLASKGTDFHLAD